MAFTEVDCIRECLAKIMLAEAWSQDGTGGITEDSHKVLEKWVNFLKIEGPEQERIKHLLHHPVDQFQAEVFHNEFKATLLNSVCRTEASGVMRNLKESVKNLTPLEEKFFTRLEAILNDRSGLEKLFQDSLQFSKVSSPLPK